MAICNAVNSFIHKGAPAEARGEVFGNGPAACWATLLPKANSVEEQGGFCVSGHFSYGSSSSFSRWVMVPSRLTERDGKQWFRAHILPREDVHIKEDSWDAMGLRGTASIDYTIADKFVRNGRNRIGSLAQGPKPYERRGNEIRGDEVERIRI